MQNTLCRSGRLSRILMCGVVAAWALLASAAGALAQPAAGKVVDPSEYLYKLGFKFQAASTCSNVKCHGAPSGGAAAAEYKNDSFTLWSAEGTADMPPDPHHTSFKTLRGAPAKAIGQKLGIAVPATDAKCISCHSLNPPANLQDTGFQVTEGVTCNACHGPSGAPVAGGGKGWGDFHSQKPWVATQRQAFAGKHEEMLSKFGWYDTKPLVERAQRCTSCHLAIDPAMVAAGHPQPMFELNWFSLTYSNRHWTDPTDKYFGAKLWAAGQVVALRDALKQIADRAETPGTADREIFAAYNEAMAHYMVFSPAFAAGAIPGSMSDVAAQLTAARAVLTGGAAKRPDLAKAARAGADAVEKLNPAVTAYTPTKDTTMKVLAAIVNQTTLADTLGGFGIEQQRDALFALYDAYAKSADKDPKAEETRDAIGSKLFPTDKDGKLISADKVPAAQFKAALAEVKGAMGVK